MKRSILGLSLSSLLAACGGSHGNAAASKSFTYGAPQAPTQSEQAAAATAQGHLSATADFSAAPSAEKGASIIALADELAFAELGASTPVPHPGGPELPRALRNADYSACTTVTATSVTFRNCSQQEGGFTITLNGSVTVAAGAVSWDINGDFSGTSPDGATGSVSLHQSGNLAVTATTISGKALSEFSGTVTSRGQTFNFGLATAAVMNLTYQSTPTSCVTGGTLEVKRVWTQRPAGVSGANDVAIKLTWTGCNAVQVAHSQ